MFIVLLRLRVNAKNFVGVFVSLKQIFKFLFRRKGRFLFNYRIVISYLSPHEYNVVFSSRFAPGATHHRNRDSANCSHLPVSVDVAFN